MQDDGGGRAGERHGKAMIADTGDWRSRDLAVLWHPCTQMREHLDHALPLVPIARGAGAWLVGHGGRRYLDAVSRLWTNLFGPAAPRNTPAIDAAATRLVQVLLARFRQPPPADLS